MKAQHEGRCGLCEQLIHEGDDIESYEGEWCHSQCVEDEGATEDWSR